jgi:hypothetical protein
MLGTNIRQAGWPRCREIDIMENVGYDPLTIHGAVLVSMAVLGAASAQETTSGSIAGGVVDPQGAPVPGAVVTISSDQGSRDLVTDQRGRFFAPYLTPAVYSVRVELTGFSPIERANIVVRLGQRVELPFELEVGTVEEVVQVTAQSPVVDMSSTTAGGVLDSDSLQALPVGRRFTETLYMVPGVSNGSGVGEANPSINGSSGLKRCCRLGASSRSPFIPQNRPFIP